VGEKRRSSELARRSIPLIRSAGVMLVSHPDFYLQGEFNHAIGHDLGLRSEAIAFVG
jgi:hypothetical protein